ncbi:hypothetical protein HHI36_008171 [Cryptolaemus montrouzieri]|uniref:Uncharacterized protein n=1 Tax=Cryptolaemus montrouzieri TaxID=559131 RepID=A0ABD2MRP6_9CUCU
MIHRKGKNRKRKEDKGKRKLVKDMSRLEHKAAKIKRKDHCRNYRAKKNTLKEVTNTFIRENTSKSVCSVSVSPVTLRSPEFDLRMRGAEFCGKIRKELTERKTV